jgi:YD repeat-containing protein
MILAGFFVLLVFSCSKNNDNPASTATKYCGTINYHNSVGLIGAFSGGLVNGKYGLTTISLTEDGVPETTTFSRDGSGHLVDQVGWVFTYDKDNNLVKIVEGTTNTGTAAFSFDTNSHLTGLIIDNADQNGISKFTWTYTYDSNDDPVKILAHLTNTTNSGILTADYDITADYLTDKPGFIYLFPEFAPFSPVFAYGFYLSRHLINKWVIKINSKDENGVAAPTINFTQQYTYTYDANGRVGTMVHTGNSNNIFTFTYADCH